MVNLNNSDNFYQDSNSDKIRLLETLREVDEQATLLETSFPSTFVSRPLARIGNTGRFQAVTEPSNPSKSR